MNIVIYTKSNCPNCTTAKALLKSKGLEYEEIESINVRLAGNRDLARLFARAIEAAHGIKENT